MGTVHVTSCPRNTSGIIRQTSSIGLAAFRIGRPRLRGVGRPSCCCRRWRNASDPIIQSWRRTTSSLESSPSRNARHHSWRRLPVVANSSYQGFGASKRPLYPPAAATAAEYRQAAAPGGNGCSTIIPLSQASTEHEKKLGTLHATSCPRKTSSIIRNTSSIDSAAVRMGRPRLRGVGRPNCCCRRWRHASDPIIQS